MKRILCLLILVMIIFYMLLATTGCSKQKETEIPDWVLNPPEDENHLYAVGIGRSKDFRVAIRTAYQEGRTEIAQTINAKVSGMFKRFEEDTESTSKVVVSEAINGCIASKQEVKKDGVVYRAYVLMEMPIGKASASSKMTHRKQIKVYGYGFPQADATTEEKQKLSAYLAAIGDACSEMLAFREVSVSSFGLSREESSAQVEEVTMQTRVNRSRVNGKIGSRLKVCGETRVFEERNEKSETHHLFQNWIKFEFAGNLILTRSMQELFTKPKMPDIAKIANRVETPDIELIDTEGIEKALEESGIKITKVEYLDDGLCKVTLLQLTDEFLTTLDTKDIVSPPETSTDKIHTIFSASQEAFKELEERVEKYEYFEELKKDKRFNATSTQAFEELEEEVEKYEKFKKEQGMK